MKSNSSPNDNLGEELAVAKLAKYFTEGKEPPIPKLAFSTKETAQILGVSPITVFRLKKRGLLRSSTAIRHGLFSRQEIERFLAATTK